ncbi:MAG: hypothetical protein IJ223_03630 [Clostridia bacterium]|nr:hypothetical protein [Clostridia bacterium]
MEKIKEEFNIPYYLFEEIIEYVELTAKGYCKTMKWVNIKALMNCAKVKNSLTQEQVNFLIEKYCRE